VISAAGIQRWDACGAGVVAQAWGSLQRIKVFWFFFAKKNRFLPLGFHHAS
jgi:hypothetical protein